jgi:peptide/nickel transport system substrate-binding protein
MALVIQAMTRDAGFDVKIQSTEFATSLTQAEQGNYQAYLLNWSGRTDPDGNIFSFTRTGGGQNDGRYSNAEVDKLLDDARTELDLAKRQALYARAARIAYGDDVHRIYLWHRKNIMAHSARLSGYRPIADGLVRLQGVRLQ